MRPLELDPEIREAVRDLPDFVFSTDTVPMMRQNAPFPPVPAPDIERIDLRTDTNGGVALTLLRPRDAAGDLPALYWMHGGGTVIGNRFMDNARLNAAHCPAPASASNTGWHRKRPIRCRWTTATTDCGTSLITRPICGWIRAASGSADAAPVAYLPLLSGCVGATGGSTVWHSHTSSTRCSMTG
jgi:hypothetical protein